MCRLGTFWNRVVNIPLSVLLMIDDWWPRIRISHFLQNTTRFSISISPAALLAPFCFFLGAEVNWFIYLVYSHSKNTKAMFQNVAFTVNGEMVLPWQTLHLEGCHDFELCARHNKSFECDTYNREQEHHNFMKGRTFRILFVKNGIWLKGKVSHWIEYYMDR